MTPWRISRWHRTGPPGSKLGRWEFVESVASDDAAERRLRATGVGRALRRAKLGEWCEMRVCSTSFCKVRIVEGAAA